MQRHAAPRNGGRTCRLLRGDPFGLSPTKVSKLLRGKPFLEARSTTKKWWDIQRGRRAKLCLLIKGLPCRRAEASMASLFGLFLIHAAILQCSCNRD